MPNAENQKPMVDVLGPRGNGVLVVAHPGHELRVHGWLERVKPLVFVLTDGSGGAGESRLESTRHLLERTGARPGRIFGRYSDRMIYQAILDGEFARFTALVDELACSLQEQKSDYVVGDAIEGYNPAHDVCRLLIDAAVGIVTRTRSEPLLNYAYPLTGSPSAAPANCSGEAVRLVLDAEAFERKLQAARAYEPLQGEVEAAFGEAGQGAFQVECLFPVVAGGGITEPEEPQYERYGEMQVAAGRYKTVLRYREHFVPLKEAVWRHVKDAHRAVK